MSQKEKLIKRFCDKPKDFTYDELRKLLSFFGYTEDESGNGSRVKFFNKDTGDIINLHKPHPGNILKSYIINMIYDKLKEADLI